MSDLFNGIFGYVEANHPNFKLFLSMDLWALGNAFGTDPDITKYSDLMVSKLWWLLDIDTTLCL